MDMTVSKEADGEVNNSLVQSVSVEKSEEVTGEKSREVVECDMPGFEMVNENETVNCFWANTADEIEEGRHKYEAHEIFEKFKVKSKSIKFNYVSSPDSMMNIAKSCLPIIDDSELSEIEMSSEDYVKRNSEISACPEISNHIYFILIIFKQLFH